MKIEQEDLTVLFRSYRVWLWDWVSRIRFIINLFIFLAHSVLIESTHAQADMESWATGKI